MTALLDRDPDAEIRLQLRATVAGGRKGPIRSGYRPAHRVRPDCLTSGIIDLAGREWLSPGEESLAFVTFVSPEHYPGSLRAGQVLDVQEGSQVVGQATIVRVLNPMLLAPADNPSDPTKSPASDPGSVSGTSGSRERVCRRMGKRALPEVLAEWVCVPCFLAVVASYNLITFAPKALFKRELVAAALVVAGLGAGLVNVRADRRVLRIVGATAMTAGLAAAICVFLW